MGTDPRRKSEYTAFIEPISWAKILDLTKKVSYRKRKIYKMFFRWDSNPVSL